MRDTDLVFFRDSLRSFLEFAFVSGQIDSLTCDRIKSWLGKHEAAEYARQLFRDRIVDIPAQLIRLQLKKLRELNGREFNHIEIVFITDTGRRRRKCFVGHRFSPAVERTLRWNLRQILEPYNVELDWSGRDLRSVQILEDILNRIRNADFCVFDNQGTKGKPNVYIEAGMCIALGKPFVLFEYEPTSPDPKGPGPIPSDLSYALALRYRHYRQLFRDFYLRLPVFFEKNVR